MEAAPSRHRQALGWTLLLLLTGCAQASPPTLQPIASGTGWQHYNLEVSVRRAAPDCFERTVVLVNGMHSPTLRVQAGTRVNVTVVNRIPVDFPSLFEGLTLHWHGLPMYGEASWYDGAMYADMCPIAPGSNFTYSFVVETPPGTYFWHDHSFAWKGDGLQGALVVLPPAGTAEVWQYDDEHVLLVTDWWHTESNVLAMRLNRPFDAARADNVSGSWAWVGLPQAVLINSKGYYADCQLHPGLGTAPTPARCTPSLFTVPPGRSAAQPWASDTNPGCTHERVVVHAGRTYRLRIIGGTELMYFTMCFEGHNVTVVAADAMPVAPWETACVDVNAGQRVDVLLTATHASGDFWISVHGQHRQGFPSGYAVLSYTPSQGQGTLAGQGADRFPSTPAPQPGSVPPWSLEQIMQIRMHPQLLQPATATPSNSTSSPSSPPLPSGAASPWSAYLDPSRGLPTLRVPGGAPNRRVRVALTQPLMSKTGMLRWALNNIVTPSAPVCEAYRHSLQRNPRWLSMFLGNTRGDNQSALGETQGTSSAVRAMEYGRAPLPTFPAVGLQFVSVEAGEVVDVVLQNDAANAQNGDYRGVNRTAMEQHPFHLHGHHFWVLGVGRGLFDPFDPAMAASLNMVDPPMRDSATVPVEGWIVIRFVANNPGAWPLHCHILWHHYMGQQLHFLESRSQWTPQPPHFPPCPRQCLFNFNPFSRDWVDQRWGYTGYPLP